MIDWTTAHQIATAHAASIPMSEPGDRAVVDDRLTVAYDFGWKFVFQSSWYLQTGDARWRLLNNHPFLVDNREGRVLPLQNPEREAALQRFQQQWSQGLPLA